MKTLSIDSMDWEGGKSDQEMAAGAITCGLSALAVVVGIVATGASGGSLGLFAASFIVSNAAMAWTCISAAS